MNKVKYMIIGEKSKIGKYITKYMPKNYVQISEKNFDRESIDLLFLSCDSKKAKEIISKQTCQKTRIIDLSGSQKLNSQVNKRNKKSLFSYGFEDSNPIHKNISNPGCSSLAILSAIYPLKKALKKQIFVDVNFSVSAMRYGSENHKKIKENIQSIHPLTHFHQDEINYVLENSLKVKMATNIIDIPRGLSCSIFAKTKHKVNIKKHLEMHYKKNKNIVISDQAMNLKEFINTTKIGIFVKQEKNIVFINVMLDNLTAGGAYQAVQMALYNIK